MVVSMVSAGPVAATTPPPLSRLDNRLRWVLVVVGVLAIVMPISLWVADPATSTTVVTETPQTGGGKKTTTEDDSKSLVQTLAGIGTLLVLSGAFYGRIISIKTPFGEIGLAAPAEQKLKEEIAKAPDLTDDQKRQAQLVAAELIMGDWWGPAPNPPPKDVQAKAEQAIQIVQRS